MQFARRGCGGHTLRMEIIGKYSIESIFEEMNAIGRTFHAAL
jgi:hypothetical protein